MRRSNGAWEIDSEKLNVKVDVGLYVSRSQVELLNLVINSAMTEPSFLVYWMSVALHFQSRWLLLFTRNTLIVPAKYKPIEGTSSLKYKHTHTHGHITISLRGNQSCEETMSALPFAN